MSRGAFPPEQMGVLEVLRDWEKLKQAGAWVGVKHCPSVGLVFLGSLQLSSAITASEPDQLCQSTERAICTKPLKYPLKVDLLESAIYFFYYLLISPLYHLNNNKKEQGYPGVQSSEPTSCHQCNSTFNSSCIFFFLLLLPH